MEDFVYERLTSNLNLVFLFEVQGLSLLLVARLITSGCGTENRHSSRINLIKPDRTDAPGLSTGYPYFMVCLLFALVSSGQEVERNKKAYGIL
jgi:hypothetical protein